MPRRFRDSEEREQMGNAIKRKYAFAVSVALANLMEDIDLDCPLEELREDFANLKDAFDDLEHEFGYEGAEND